MRRLILLASHFPPSNLASVHRARLWSHYLPEFGWTPVILTAHYTHYCEGLDWDLAQLLPPGLEVIRTPAVPAFAVRDVGLRAIPWHVKSVVNRVKEDRADFLHITVPSFFSALVGPLAKQLCGIPYGIDYIDPWVHDWPGSHQIGTKAWASRRLADLLEPLCVRSASLITGVAPGYYEDVLGRNPNLRSQAVTASMPYGYSEIDFQWARASSSKPSEFNPSDGLFHFVYAGAMLPKAHNVLCRFFEGFRSLRESDPTLSHKIRLHFIGTGSSPVDPNGFQVLEVARASGVADQVTEHPHRMPYVTTLVHLAACSAILIIGSTEVHYSPSKVYQAVQARRPILALLHEDSTAVQVLRQSNAGEVISFTEHSLPNPETIKAGLRAIVSQVQSPKTVKWSMFDRFSARESARKLATALDAALARQCVPQAVIEG